MAKDCDPTEDVMCGKCQAVNTVPFGLDKFKCYSCGSMVTIAREITSACAAASSTAVGATAVHLSEIDHSWTLESGTSSSTSASTDASKKPGKSVGFFGKLQQTMDKTIQKVDKMLTSNPSAGAQEPSQEGASLLRSKQSPVQKSHPPPAAKFQMLSEEEQIQWALNASLFESQGASPAVVTPQRVRPPSTSAPPAAVKMPTKEASTIGPARAPGVIAGSFPSLQAAESPAAEKLRHWEERAAHAEWELAAAQTREAAATAQRSELQRQLDENEGVVRGLTEQIDIANTQVDARLMQCQILEEALAAAQEVAALSENREEGANGGSQAGEGNLEQQTTAAQLLARIAELEATFLHATQITAEPAGQDPDSTEEGERQATATASAASACAGELVEDVPACNVAVESQTVIQNAESESPGIHQNAAGEEAPLRIDQLASPPFQAEDTEEQNPGAVGSGHVAPTERALPSATSGVADAVSSSSAAAGENAGEEMGTAAAGPEMTETIEEAGTSRDIQTAGAVSASSEHTAATAATGYFSAESDVIEPTSDPCSNSAADHADADTVADADTAVPSSAEGTVEQVGAELESPCVSPEITPPSHDSVKQTGIESEEF